MGSERWFQRVWAKGWIALLVCALMLVRAEVCLGGEPSAADKETARGLIDRGDDLSQKGDLRGALQAYRGAYAIVRVPTTGAAVARTLKSLGQLVEAKKVAEEVAAMSAREGEPSVLTKAREEAAAMAKDLAPRIAKLTLVLRGVPEGASAKVNIDDREVQASELGFGIPVDPGRHQVSASAGSASGSSEVTLGEGESKSLTLTLESSKSKGGAAARGERPQPTKKSSKRTIGFILGGVGVAGLATAGITGAMLLSRDSEINDNCPDKRCNAKGRDLIDGSKPLLLVNGIAWGVGIAGLAVGGYLVLSGGHEGQETAVGPALIPGGAGVSLMRGF